jgi:thiol:disulfide interchange protein DsbD
METVKTAFGFVILALPVFLLERIIGDVWGCACGRCSASPSLLGVYRQPGAKKRGCAWCKSCCCRRAGERTPLQDWAFGTPGQTQAHLNFTQIKNVDELNSALAQAKANR